jgi:peptidoglycan hydrolase-like protein with peptidoglycan-binding domain
MAQERVLSIQMQGDDVQLLHTRLLKLGFTIASDEIKQKLFGETTRIAVSAFQKKHGLKASGVVDEACADLIASSAAATVSAASAKAVEDDSDSNAQQDGSTALAADTGGATANGDFVVHGSVRQPDGSPFTDGLVLVFDRDMRGEESLGQAYTDASGLYSVTYSAEQFARAEKKTADLVVRVTRRDDTTPLASSPIIFNAQPVETVDLIIGGVLRGISEYERYIRELSPVIENVPLSALNLADIQFLTGEIGINPRHIAFLVISARHGDKTGLPPAAFYGFARQNLPTRLHSLTLQDREVLRRALLAALSANIIPHALHGQLDQILDGLRQQIVRHAFETPSGGAASLGDLLATSIVSNEDQEKFLSLYFAHAGTAQEFWKELSEHPDFKDEKNIADIQFTLQVGALTKNHLPLVRLLQEMRANDEIGGFRDLAALTVDDWAALLEKQVDEAVVGFPPNTPGENDEEKLRTYADTLAAMVQAAMPTPVIASRVMNDGTPETEDLAAFFRANPDFKFESTNIDKYLKERPETALADAKDEEKLVGQLKGMQRVFNLTPHYEEMRVLLDDGLHSAQSIVRMGEGAFIKQYGDKFAAKGTAESVYARASQTAAMSLTMLAKFAGAFNAPNLHVLSATANGAADNNGGSPGQPGGGNVAVVDEIPTWMTLFGSLDLCECVHCRSVYSPAAYLVDVLSFLRKVASGNQTAQEVLLERRPDIGGIELSCENTNTTLPYIDLVNEVLENAVSPFFPVQQGNEQVWPQTNSTADELRANPEYINQAAYDALAAQVYPFGSPFNLWLEEARAYLETLGSSRHEVMETFRRGGQLFTNGLPVNVPAEVAIACDRLKISVDECRVMSADYPPALPLRAFYGYPAETVSCFDPDTNTTSNLPWKECLARVPEFLRRAGISYLELLDLLETRFVNPSQNQNERLAVSISGCDLTTAMILHSNDPALQRLHRFIRLWRKSGWEIKQLDKVFDALAADNINDEFLKKLSHVKQLEAELKLPLERLLSFWANIDATGENSLYQKLFQNKAVLSPLDAAFALTTPPAPPELSSAGSLTISGNVPALLAALRIDNADLDAIRSATGLADDPVDNFAAPLNLANISLLYRHTLLAKSLKLSIKDLLALRELTGINLFASPQETSEFVEITARVRRTRFSVGQLSYLFRPAGQNVKSFAPQKEQASLLVKNLKDGLKQIVDDNQLVQDPEGDTTRKKLLTFLDAALVAETMSILDGSAVYAAPLTALPAIVFPVALQSKISYDAAAQELSFDGTMTQADKTALMELSEGAEYRNAVENLYNKSNATPDNSLTYTTPLNHLPGKPFPAPLKYKVSFDEKAQLLRFTGGMALSEKESLLEWWDDAAYQNAVTSLFDQPREFISTHLAAFLSPAEASAYLLEDPSMSKEARIAYVLGHLLPHLRVTLSKSLIKQTLGDALKLENTLAGLLLDELLASRVKPDESILTDFLALLDGGILATYYKQNDLTGDEFTGIDPHVNFAWGGAAPAPGFDPLDFSVRWTGALFAPATEAYTFHLLASGGVRLRVNEQLVIDQWSNNSGVEQSGTIELQGGQYHSISVEYTQAGTQASAALRWSSPSTPKEIVPQTAFVPGSVFQAYALLHKAASLINTFQMTFKEAAYLLDPATGFEGFDLNDLPLDADNAPTGHFAQWNRLQEFFAFKAGLPEGATLIDALAADSLGEARVKLATATGWSEQETEELAGQSGFDLSLEDFQHGEKLAKLRAGRNLSKRLGVSAQKLFDWAQNEPTIVQAHEIKNILKAKYDEEQWLRMAKPIKDVLREKQRAALVSHLVLNPSLIGKAHLRDSTDLYEHFLIDVEMSPCQMTTRIKQAISSVQLFVQRCLMNLEPEVSIGEQEAKQWQWMKNYRVWEANRKVFLYPENWIEPELRDDKTPFFKSLENDILQGELTADRAETSFRNYLEKLDEVAHLEVCGIYQQLEYPRPKIEFGQPPKEKPEVAPLVDVLHVFGRTRGNPHLYYYRQRINSRHWTPWERVELDIQSDHLIPVIYNRRLHLFWPVFTEKVLEEVPNGQDLLPRRYWEIQLAWSEYRNKKWSPQKLSAERLSLAADAYEFQPVRNFSFTGAIDNADLVIRTYVEGMGVGSPENPRSYPLGEFRFTGCNGALSTSATSAGLDAILAATGTNPDNMEFVEDPAYSDGKLYLFTAELPEDVNVPYVEYIEAGKDIPVLKKTPGTFHLLVPHQGTQFASQYPFFYRDQTRTFFVTPHDEKVPLETLGDTNSINPGAVFMWANSWALEGSLIDFGSAGFDTDARSQPLLDGDEDSTPLASGSQPSTTKANSTESAMQDGDAAHVEFGESDSGVSSSRAITSASGSSQNKIAASEWQMAEEIVSAYDSYQNVPSPTAYKIVKRYLFETFYHPYVCDMIGRLNRFGIDRLLDRSTQENSATFFMSRYSPVSKTVKYPYPLDDVDFRYGGAYSQYNWELFFHVPLLIADRLGRNHRFDEAQKWFHYIFDPTDRSPDYDVPQRYWKTRPFFENADHHENVQELMELLSYTGDDDEKLKRKQQLEQQVKDWRENPFNPHLIARLRNTAYQKNVVMKYLDNLIAWGDQLFRRDTIESINEATQLYLLASEILGRRPVTIPEEEHARKTFYHLKDDLDAFSNAVVEIENSIPASGQIGQSDASQDESILGMGMTLYFCIPKNDKLLAYWDTVADRLFKIRHCMNIEGVVRQLPMFEPPIDPALLVKAFAMGIDLSSVLNDMNAPLPHYRFATMLQKAQELCADLKGLGQSLLAAMEKRDAEEMALLRSTHEINLLASLRQIKEQQIEEAKHTLDGLEQSRKLIAIRHDYYKNIEFTNDFEKAHMELTVLSTIFEVAGQMAEFAAAGAHATPTAIAGGAGGMGSPVALVQYGGPNVANGLEAFGKAMSLLASFSNLGASLSSTLGAYHRRYDEWKLQERLSAQELQQIDRQILAAQIRLAMAEHELSQHGIEVENAKELDAYMRDKFTNRELYDWMVSQISTVYFQSYQMAYDIAKRAEKSCQFELGAPETSFIQFGYWDSLKKGLLAGEKLSYDLRRMELAYLDRNKREYEITRHISLAMLDPVALIKLKETGECFVKLPEMLFDLDYPGHYARRIKSAALTIPSVTGPYTNINCTLTLLSNSVRKSNLLQNNQYARSAEGEDARFADNVGAIHSIVTSNAQSDSGMFEANFRDERYLPFEGAGAISEWRIELPRESNHFDFNTVSDVVLHLRYTAREGGELLRAAARKAIKDSVVLSPSEDGASELNLVRVFSARHEFPNEWHRFLHSPSGHSLTLNLSADRFPFYFRNTATRIHEVALYLKLKPVAGEGYSNGEPFKFRLWSPDAIEAAANSQNAAVEPDAVSFQMISPVPPSPSDQQIEHFLPKATTIAGEDKSPGTWRLDVDTSDLSQTDAYWLKTIGNEKRLDPGVVEDVLLIVRYRVENL